MGSIILKLITWIQMVILFFSKLIRNIFLRKDDEYNIEEWQNFRKTMKKTIENDRFYQKANNK